MILTPRRAAAALLGAGAVALATAACSTAGQPAPAAAPSTTAPAKPTAKGVTGRITAENGAAWTVVTAKGKQFTVTLTPQTRYGTAKAPATQQQFTVGTTVRVSGTPDGSTVTATRVAVPAAHPAATATPVPS